MKDLSGDGKITQKDIMIGRGVIKKRNGGMIKSKGMAGGGKVKAKGMAMGGQVKSKGMAMGGRVKSKGMAMGGKVQGFRNGGAVMVKTNQKPHMS
jgi:hypothetical protein|tara:strand:- start:219 stop:503 length:285 start_codon:yes stop_codon:yes gene_type:complete